MTRYIFITGGVASSLGKGIASAGLGALLQARGYSVKLRKLDPYLNVDPGTMSPFQHGEVFVTEDGTETDLDLGHYERFTDVNSSVEDNITTGQIYNKVIERERRGDYLGGTVQIIPHVTDQIKEFILNNNKNIDFCLCEIGGTVGDIEGLPFFEAIRQLGNELPDNKTCFVHLTLVPYIAAAGEIKTKPTQHSVKELRSIGIQPDVLLCRSEKRIDKSDIKKIAVFCAFLFCFLSTQFSAPVFAQSVPMLKGYRTINYGADVIGEITSERLPAGRLVGSIAAMLKTLRNGVNIFRVHDVKETADAIRVWNFLK